MNIYSSRLYILTLLFIILVPIGTLSHEFGHIIVAQNIGYTTELYFSSMNFSNEFKINLFDTYNTNKLAIDQNLPFEGDFFYEGNLNKYNRDLVLILWGGILQTLSFGIIGFIILIIRKIKKVCFSFVDWVFVFLTFFLSRSVLNMVSGFLFAIFNKNKSYFMGDEPRIAKHIGVFEGSFTLLFGLSSTLILGFVIFYIIPKKYRLTFILSGILGSIIGFVIWMIVLGPILLPE